MKTPLLLTSQVIRKVSFENLKSQINENSFSATPCKNCVTSFENLKSQINENLHLDEQISLLYLRLLKTSKVKLMKTLYLGIQAGRTHSFENLKSQINENYRQLSISFRAALF